MNGPKKIPDISGFGLIKLIHLLLIKPLPTLLKVSQKYDGLVKFSATKSQSILLVTKPEFVQHILKTNEKNYTRIKVIKELKPLLGDGLFESEGELWEQQRQMLMPAFRQQLYFNYEETIKQELNDFVESTKSRGSQIIDVEKVMYTLMLKVLFKTQLYKNASYNWDEIIFHLHRFLKIASMENQKLREIKKAIYKPFGLTYRNKSKSAAIESVAYLHKIADDCIAKALADEENAGFSMQLMIGVYKEQKTTKEQIRDEILNFVFAGFDTVAVGIIWTLYGILKTPEAKEKLAAELTIPQIISIRNSEYNYLKACVKEGLRWFPPVWSMHKSSINDDYLGEYFIPKNTYVMISPYLMHRNPDVWKDADDFNPQRFIDGDLKGTSFSYIPFGQGSRICIGNHLAVSEMQCIIGSLFSNFNIELISKKLHYKPNIIVKLKNKFLIRLSAK